MKDTGMIRKIDDLGRIVIPKEMRKIFHFNVGTEIEFFVEDNRMVLQKYVGDNNIAEKIRELKSIVETQIDEIGLDKCCVIQNELDKIEQMLQ